MDRPGKTEAIACSLDATEQAGRGREFAALARAALIERERSDGCLRLRYRRNEAVEAAVSDLVRRERQCCPFLSFELRAEGDELLLSISAPAQAEALLDAVFAL